MIVHLIDGTFELFRAYYGARSVRHKGREVAATRSLLFNLARFIQETEAPHIAIAFDHVIESFRNKLFTGYKTGEGMDPDLYQQFGLAEEGTRALGLITWPMVRFEADDAIATAAKRFSKVKSVQKVILCSPDKDLMQCLAFGKNIQLWDRLRDKYYAPEDVEKKFGVPPSSIPDLLALVGDSADGIPGIPRWGLKSASLLLSHYRRIEKIPKRSSSWIVQPRGAMGLSESLESHRKEAYLFKKLATLRTNVPLKERVKDLRWEGVQRTQLKRICEVIGDERLLQLL